MSNLNLHRTPQGALDHLVVIAASLDEGMTWCQSTLGIGPSAGGAHPLMGTHNRLLSIASETHPRCYLEIIAIDPAAQPQRAPGERRWFDMDDPHLQAHVAQHGPRLLHWVARVPELAAAQAALRSCGVDPGLSVSASRATEHGELRWQIAIRPDGQRPLDGVVPTPIAWERQHPSDHLSASLVRLTGFGISHPQAERASRALAAIGLGAVPVQPGPAGLHASFDTPIGVVHLAHPSGIETLPSR